MTEIKRFVLACATAIIALFTMLVGFIIAIPLSIAAAVFGNRMVKKMQQEVSARSHGQTIEGEFSYIDEGESKK
ncbi:hypothetical protein [Vibrio hannami]|uniref:hypothetical protein n=1 Tax=Vibrio hannami TaxID=2717094 RepID=UPI003EB8C371